MKNCFRVRYFEIRTNQKLDIGNDYGTAEDANIAGGRKGGREEYK